jgi:sec-independent protein translocase protein TatB
MNFLGIGPGEIFLILILLLVVVGPERLPEFARNAGRFVVRVRNWIARSPDAQLVLRAREELELELDELRRSLTEEVEVVRKELETVRGDLAEATRMVEESAEEVARTRVELDQVSDAVDDAARTIAPPAQQPALVDAAGEPLLPETTAPAEIELPADPGPIGTRQRAIEERKAADTAAQAEAVNGQPVPRSYKPGQQPPLRPPAPAAEAQPTEDDVAVLSRRLETLSADFSQQIQVLTAELQALRERRAAAASAAPSVVELETVAAAESEHVSVPTAEMEATTLVSAEAAVDTRRRCKGVTRNGEPCGAAPLKGQEYCRVHAGQGVLEEVSS